MNNDSIPTVAELTEAGYTVEVTHLRMWDTAFVRNGKVVKNTTLASVPSISRNCPEDYWALRAKGGTTEVVVTDPKNGTTIYGSSVCRSDENYNKKTGVSEALKRVKGLMLVAERMGGFKYCLQ